MGIEVFDQTLVLAFWLCFTRWLSMLMLLPIFDEIQMPGILKVLTTLVMTYAFFPYTKNYVLTDLRVIGADNIIYLTLLNTIVGLFCGYIVKSIMSMYVSAGSLMTQQIGFGAIRYFDPTAGMQIGPIEKLLQLTIVGIVLTSGALIPMFKGGLMTFQTLPITNLGKLLSSTEFFLRMFKSLFVSGFLLATPIVLTNLLIYLVMGIIARMVPQMNILMVSFVVNISLGLLVFIMSNQEIVNVAYRLYVERLGDWFQYLSN